MQRGPAAVCKTNDEKIKLEAEFASSFCVNWDWLKQNNEIIF